MDPAQIVAEWRRGCSCAPKGAPWECADCTGAAMRAVARWVDAQHQRPVPPPNETVRAGGVGLGLPLLVAAVLMFFGWCSKVVV